MSPQWQCLKFKFGKLHQHSKLPAVHRCLVGPERLQDAMGDHKEDTSARLLTNQVDLDNLAGDARSTQDFFFKAEKVFLVPP